MDIDDYWDPLFTPDFDSIERADINAHIDLLQKLRSISSHLIRQEIERFPRYEDQSSELASIGVTSTMLRRLVEILNSIISSIEERQLTGALIQVRPMLELLAELAFLVQDPKEITHRVSCFMMMELHNEKQSLEDCKDEMLDADVRLQIDKRISELEEKLKLPIFNLIQADYKKLKPAGEIRKWYALATVNRTRYDKTRKKTVSAQINSVKWLMANLNPKLSKHIKYKGFALLSHATHSSNLIPNSISVSEQNKPRLEPIGNVTVEDYREFIRAVYVAFMPIISIIKPLRTLKQREKIDEVLADLLWHFNRLYEPGSKLREDPVFQIQQLHTETASVQAEAQRTTEQNQVAETKLLSQYADTHRKYPVGHGVLLDGKLCTLGDASAHVDGPRIGMTYAVLLNGCQVDTIDERGVVRLSTMQ